MFARLFLPILLVMTHGTAVTNAANTNLPGDEMLAEYFRAETEALSKRCLNDIKTVHDWKQQREVYRQQLQDMLGLSPLPEKTDLKATITGKVDHELFTVENIHFQSRPGLYVTANFYLPKNATNAVPTVLYLCGHAKVVTNGVSYGNKTAYQHHGAWFARNGYACLIIDTIQLGEIEGLHHGTYREGMWWWNSRGYTPAGVEAWNSIRALDYLETRPEVDKTRFGVTGRSGGGAYSWVLGALDDRIKVSAPVAGITDLENYVVDGAVEGHCDCMFMINTYRWDYPLLAAMSAPRALMFANSDKDRIFPLEGIQRTHAKVRHVYKMNEAASKLALLITEGPHDDTQDLQLPVFRWFNRQLKGEDPIVEMAATKFFEPQQLRVLQSIPADQINTRIHEQFVAKAPEPSAPKSPDEWIQLKSKWRTELAQEVFAGWPQKNDSPTPKQVFVAERDGLYLSAYDFSSQRDVTLRLYVLQATQTPETATMRVLNDSQWSNWIQTMQGRFDNELRNELKGGKSAAAGDAFANLRKELEDRNEVLIVFAPRGIGLSAWSGDEKKRIQIRRRFMLLGQTLDSMQVWDIRRAIQTARLVQTGRLPLSLEGESNMAANVCYASLFEPGIKTLTMKNLPSSHHTGPDYLNVLRVLDLPQAVAMALERSPVELVASRRSDWSFPSETRIGLEWKNELRFRPE